MVQIDLSATLLAGGDAVGSLGGSGVADIDFTVGKLGWNVGTAFVPLGLVLLVLVLSGLLPWRLLVLVLLGPFVTGLPGTNGAPVTRGLGRVGTPSVCTVARVA